MQQTHAHDVRNRSYVVLLLLVTNACFGGANQSLSCNVPTDNTVDVEGTATMPTEYSSKVSLCFKVTGGDYPIEANSETTITFDDTTYYVDGVGCYNVALHDARSSTRQVHAHAVLTTSHDQTVTGSVTVDDEEIVTDTLKLKANSTSTTVGTQLSWSNVQPGASRTDSFINQDPNTGSIPSVTITGDDVSSDGTIHLGGSDQVRVEYGEWVDEIGGLRATDGNMTLLVGTDASAGSYASDITATLTCE